MEELAKQANVDFYGPGFPGFSGSLSITEILDGFSSRHDLICVGHAWLSDRAGSEVERFPGVELKNCRLPKVIFLNKEYVNLTAKLEFVRKNNFQLGVSHHFQVQDYQDFTGVKFVYSPFGYAREKFIFSRSARPIDIGFSGVLANENLSNQVRPIRVEILNRLFWTILDVPLLKKREFQEHTILWNGTSRYPAGRLISRITAKSKWMNSVEYAQFLNKTKIVLHTDSPIGLISPRIYECMASGAIVFCQESDRMRQTFPDGTYFSFAADLSDFQEKLVSILSTPRLRDDVSRRANSYVSKTGAWDIRVSKILEQCSQLVTKKIENSN